MRSFLQHVRPQYVQTCYKFIVAFTFISENFNICYNFETIRGRAFIFDILIAFDWLVVSRINVDLAIFQQYLDLEAEGNHSLKIQVARPGIEPRSSFSTSKELNHLATTAPYMLIPFDKFDAGFPFLQKN